jgi:DinB superfamily
MTIAPDTKDWTWVLDRPCPECGFDCRTFPREQVATMLREITAQWRDVLTTRDDVSARPSPAVWSPLEYGCHVRDVYGVYDGRLQRMLHEDGPHYLNWDQDATAEEKRYAEQDPGRVADELERAGRAIAARFDTVSDGAWERTGVRSDGARFTVESFARYLIHDPVHHLWDVRR